MTITIKLTAEEVEERINSAREVELSCRQVWGEDYENEEGIYGWRLMELFSDCSEIMMNDGNWFIDEKPLDGFDFFPFFED